MVDIDAYFQRIGYRGTAEPTVETLRALHHLHPLAIPFENLSPVLGWPVPLDLPSVERKLIREGRGGYCYEQNTLFAAVLRQLGLHVRGSRRAFCGIRPRTQLPPAPTCCLR